MKQISGGGDADVTKLIDPSRYPRPVSKFPKPTGNADPEIHDGGYVGKEVVVAPKAQFPLGFSGTTRPPPEGNRQGAGGKGDIFKVGDGVIDHGEGWINVNKADGGQEKRPLKTGPHGGKYYEDEAGRKHYVGGEGGVAAQKPVIDEPREGYPPGTVVGEAGYMEAPSEYKPVGEEPTGGPSEGDDYERYQGLAREELSNFTVNPSRTEMAAVDGFAKDLTDGRPPYEAAHDLWENLNEQGWSGAQVRKLANSILDKYDTDEKSDGEPPEDDEDDIKKAHEIVDEMIEEGDVAPEDKEKVLPAAIAALARVASKPAVAATGGYLAGKGQEGGTTTFPGTSKEDEEEDTEKVDPRELVERATDVSEEVGASVAHGTEVRGQEIATDPSSTAESAGRKATEMMNQKKAENIMKEMRDGIQKNGRVTYLKMCQDRAKTLKGIIDKSDISTFNVMKDMGVTEDALSDELQKAEYMVEVLNEH